MDNISANLMGGLGNYLFQIATAYAYGLNNEKQPLFNTETTVRVHKDINEYKDNILRNIYWGKPNNNHVKYNEYGFEYSKIPKIKGSVVLNGHFQSEKYFKEFKYEIINLFSPTKHIIDNIENNFGDLLNGNTCSIHVRRGDYLKLLDHHPVCSMGYYNEAIKLMPNDTTFLIFSDDTDWCKENFVGDNFKIIEGFNDINDLYLMSKCKNNIIANSSFSWWGAWLNNNKGKTVIAPNKWFGSAKKDLMTDDVYCENWIKI